MSIRWAEFNKWSLVWVEFGSPKLELQKPIDMRDGRANDIYGVNLGEEFCYRHLAIVAGYTTGGNTAIVIPLTSYEVGDEKYKMNVVIEKSKYPYLVDNDSTVLIEKIRHIDRNTRVKKIVKSHIPHPLRRTIKRAMVKIFA